MTQHPDAPFDVEEVRRAWRRFLHTLPPQCRRPRWGRSVEDFAEEAAQENTRIRAALDAWRSVLNAAWESVVTTDLPQRLGRSWMKTRRRRRQEGVTTGEVLSEIYMSLRKHIIAYARTPKAVPFSAYVRRGVLADLDAMLAKLAVPLEVPRDVLRTDLRQGNIHRVSLWEDADEEEY